MPPIPHAKPENVLKRARELIAVEQSQAALTLLHEHVTSKRSRNTPIASLEPVMLLFVELCVTLRKGKTAKDGLYQYKNIAQNTSVQTIELVLRKFIELAENKVTEAQERAEKINLDAVEDLEATETPESILLSSVSGEQSKDRTDRAVVTPWLKFLWETYRTVLDILRNNARLEVMYQTTATQAFQFCLKYVRKTEFRRLCELLRNHMQNAAKYSTQMHAINLSDPDTLQRHLDTRFQQLNAAVDLELWQEAFRSVEDIHNLLTLSKRAPKPLMMANYYEKLTRIFLVADNHLFHSAAWVRYYNLLRTSAAAVASGTATKRESPVTTEAEVSRVASFVILSALAIPVISTSRSRGSLISQDENNKKNKSSRLTSLLNLPNSPTRAGIFKEALARGLLKRARPEIRELYNILEVDFHPLSICKKISPILTQIAEDEDMKKYIVPLQQVILTRLFQQLSQVYETVQLSFVIELASFPAPFEVSSGTIEKFIMNGCKKGDLAIRIDHALGAITFESDIFSSPKPLHPGSGAGSAEDETSAVQKLQSTPSEIVRTQLTRLSKALYVTCTYVDPSFTESRYKEKQEAYARAEAGAEKEHKDTIARRSIIERKKEAAETALATKEKEEQKLRALKQQQALVAETERLAAETKKRDADRMAKEREKARLAELQKDLDQLKLAGQNIDAVDMADMDSNTLRAMKLAQLEKEKNELSNRLKVTGKRIDHIERAFRKEEINLLPQDYEAQRRLDLQAHTDKVRQVGEAHRNKHDADVALKKRLSRLIPQYESFRDDIHERRSEEFEKRRLTAENQLKIEMDKRRKQVREERARAQREEDERIAKEEEEAERLAKEEDERLAKEEADAAEKEARKAQREADRKEREEAARKQSQREAEAEERRLKRKQEEREAAVAPRGTPERAPIRSEAAPASTVAFKPTVVPAAGGWREREAAKKAAEAAGGGLAPEVGATDAAANGTTSHVAPVRVEAPAEVAPASAVAAPPAALGGGSGAYRPGAFRRAPLNERTNSSDGPPPGPTPRPREDRPAREDQPPREDRPAREPRAEGEEEGSGLRATRAGTWGARPARAEGDGEATGEGAPADGKYRVGSYSRRGGMGERSDSGRGGRGGGMERRSGSGRDTKDSKESEPRPDRASGGRWTRGGGAAGSS